MNVKPIIPVKKVNYVKNQKPIVPKRCISANNIIVNLANEERKKETDYSLLWRTSQFRVFLNMKPNNIGLVGEKFIHEICKLNQIQSTINEKNKDNGDGFINSRSIEIKTALLGNCAQSFQHELGEIPWKTEYVIFLDISPNCVYLTIFKNFQKEHYMNKKKCEPYFPTKKITRRKNIGAFKLDTTPKINELNCLNGYTLKITNDTKTETIGNFILNSIKN